MNDVIRFSFEDCNNYYPSKNPKPEDLIEKVNEILDEVIGENIILGITVNNNWGEKDMYRIFVFPLYSKVKYKLNYDEEKFFVNKSDPIIFYTKDQENYKKLNTYQGIFLFSEDPRNNKKFKSYECIFDSIWDDRNR